MADKAYVINILQELEWEVKEAKWLLILFEMWMMSQDNIDAIILLLKNTLKTTKNNQKIQNIEENIEKLEAMKNKEKGEAGEEISSLEQLISKL